MRIKRQIKSHIKTAVFVLRGTWRQTRGWQWIVAGCVYPWLFMVLATVSPRDSALAMSAALAVAIGFPCIGISRWLAEIHATSSKKKNPARAA